ncbi:hypothetical protein [Kaistella antarctica]|uniref:Uncharacterized protein n=1 Tax=Kaistella antarctica TaxID=266748 RepID=A0A448NSU8_9FLAO|nr:hypothetical protein [Kaistella antarctica]KEY17958.1 hypothetical protein HY04_05365 [Kaistella antarctica]SEV81632.1 hypothetical protein SAMN05421765_0273 [Kaistella antarctica]VEI00386.1 Uncharacterised protein [Kaistella antarctica]
MEHILITFCRFSFYIFKVTAHTKNYVTCEPLYPIKGIEADYYCEDDDFYNDDSISKINMFVMAVIHAYDSFCRTSDSFVKYIEENRETDDVDELALLTKKYISVSYRNIQFQYLSEITEENFVRLHFNFYLTQTFPFENIFMMDEDDVKTVENCLNLVLDQNISKVISVHFTDDIYSDTVKTKIIDLSKGHFPEEKLLQEMFICYYSAPRLDIDKNPFRYDYFEKRFDSFTEDKKLGLFLVCNIDKELFMYNKFLSKLWMSKNKLWRIG